LLFTRFCDRELRAQFRRNLDSDAGKGFTLDSDNLLCHYAHQLDTSDRPLLLQS